MRLSKRQNARKGPTLAALAIAGAGAGAMALMKRERILGVIGRGGDEAGQASGSPDALAEGDAPPVTRLPKPGIG